VEKNVLHSVASSRHKLSNWSNRVPLGTMQLHESGRIASQTVLQRQENARLQCGRTAMSWSCIGFCWRKKLIIVYYMNTLVGNLFPTNFSCCANRQLYISIFLSHSWYVTCSYSSDRDAHGEVMPIIKATAAFVRVASSHQ
jgi:hypothetical protein